MLFQQVVGICVGCALIVGFLEYNEFRYRRSKREFKEWEKDFWKDDKDFWKTGARDREAAGGVGSASAQAEG